MPQNNGRARVSTSTIPQNICDSTLNRANPQSTVFFNDALGIYWHDSKITNFTVETSVQKVKVTPNICDSFNEFTFVFTMSNGSCFKFRIGNDCHTYRLSFHRQNGEHSEPTSVSANEFNVVTCQDKFDLASDGKYCWTTKKLKNKFSVSLFPYEYAKAHCNIYDQSVEEPLDFEDFILNHAYINADASSEISFIQNLLDKHYEELFDDDEYWLYGCRSFTYDRISLLLKDLRTEIIRIENKELSQEEINEILIWNHYPYCVDASTQDELSAATKHLIEFLNQLCVTIEDMRSTFPDFNLIVFGEP